MKIVIAIDSLKGSMTSIEAGSAIKEGILTVYPDADIIIKPLADGGEGTVEALVAGMNGTEVTVPVTGPLGERVFCTYGILEQSRTAIIEMAGAAGLPLVPEDQKNPMNTTTFGVGEVIRDAIEKGCRDFIVGIGGSATNDGGIGMLEALGFVFRNQEGQLVGGAGRDLLNIASLDPSGALPELKDCRFRIACDVNNPLCGELGASAVYGPQKGADPEMVSILDAALARFARITRETLGKDVANVPGTGAAGGLGYAFLAYLNGKLEPGIDIILDEIHLEQDVKNADFVITGEGKLDFQTAMGKAPIGVAKLAKKYGASVLAFAGGTTEDAWKCNEEGIDAYFSILRLPMAVEKAMEPETARGNMVCAAEQAFRLIRAARK